MFLILKIKEVSALGPKASQDQIAQPIQTGIPTEVKLAPHCWLIISQGHRQLIALMTAMTDYRQGIPLILNLVLNVTQ